MSKSVKPAVVPAVNPLLKLLLEIGPLVLFFLVNARAGIFWATAGFMVAICASLLGTWYLEHRLPKLPLVTGVFVLVFGGLTLILQDELFIKLKPTVVNLLFAAILLGGLIWRKSFLKSLLGPMFPMSDQGWRILTFRWALFFVFLALLNEIVWRNASTDTWVSFKVFGIMPLTILFSVLQLPTMTRHRLDDDEGPA
ncbi:MAG: septation protein A [Alphaproteobacteria bacterium]|jgi:intracellular septation protein|nr:septation protein A [Alphaproteobacteria bacterium]MDP6566944.1 septation protein A [Alphaproteobacteria bacterium]MDP6813744.1 septation protein A [Alphaproteobacteria bacterium]